MEAKEKYGEQRYQKIQTLINHALSLAMLCENDMFREKAENLIQNTTKKHGLDRMKGDDVIDFLYSPNKQGEEYLNEMIKIRSLVRDYQTLSEKYK